MPLSVVFRRLAEADIERIADHIARDSPRLAYEWALAMRRSCESLGDFPERAAVHRGDIRRLVISPYLVFYRIIDPQDVGRRRVLILRVLHGAMDVDRLIGIDASE